MRLLPFRGIQDPYFVWLSEVIFQQTRINQGLPYWQRFIDVFPTVTDLAQAPEEKILRLWQGLGYYTRARNMHATAKIIHTQYHGQFPNSYADLLKLKGIGPYTAAAIASICFDRPVPTIDGNVFRFISRYFGVFEDISKASTRKVFEELLKKKIDKKNPGTFNQASMEHGAIVCSPNPKCAPCVFSKKCFAFLNGQTSILPIKTKKTKSINRNFHYLVFRQKNKILMKQRKQKDVWYNLYDFWLEEGSYDTEEILTIIKNKFFFKKFSLTETSLPILHVLTHQKIYAVFYQITLNKKDFDELINKFSMKAFTIENILYLPKPKLIVNYIKNLK